MHVLWNLMTRRVTGNALRHPDRYREMFQIARKNELHRVARELNAYRTNGDYGRSIGRLTHGMVLGSWLRIERPGKG